MGNVFDYDVIVIGSGFGGSVASLRATEKGYRIDVLESGNCRLDGKRMATVCKPFTRTKVRYFDAAEIDAVKARLSEV